MASDYDRYGEYAHHKPGYQQRECNHVGIGLGFALMGAGLGAAIALLLAPKAGDELRGDIRRGMDTARSKGTDLLASAKGKVMPFRKSSNGF